MACIAKIFKMYDTHPLLMNSATGCFVYVGGEVVSQSDCKERSINWTKVSEIGILGTLENGGKLQHCLHSLHCTRTLNNPCSKFS